MITISLCMIVKNEEKVIGRCLESVKGIVDEMNIVDTGSTDTTKDIVREYTQRIFDFTWIYDFAAARNFAFQQATKEYILWLDADDVLSEEDQKKLIKLKHSLNPSIDAVSMDYHLSFDEQGGVMTQLKRYRLVKRINEFKWHGSVHEFLSVSGHLYDSNVAIQHRPLEHDANRNIEIYEKRLAQGEQFSPRDLYYYANELKDHQRYTTAVKYYLKFLDTGQGWVEDNIQACYKVADCYGHMEMKDLKLKWTLEVLKYDAPRPEVCYRLGVHFLESGQFEVAIYWFKQALEVKESVWFNNTAFKTWMPHLQLCVCYDRLGDPQLAYEHNERAAEYQPDQGSILHNREYFRKILSDNK